MTKNASNVLITGSSRGIGLVIAKTLSSAGYNVFITGRNKDVLKQVALDINARGYFAVDLKDKGAPEKLVKSAKSVIGNIDILINNAGVYSWSPVEKIKSGLIDDVLKLNLAVPYELCNLVVPVMKSNKWGRIINIGSISGAVGEANASLYSASKSGLIGMTRSLALELAEFGITVNVINPGWLKTDLAEDAICSGCIEEQQELDMIPQKRWIEPVEVAELVKYLLAEHSAGITGQSLNLCCGLSLG